MIQFTFIDSKSSVTDEEISRKIEQLFNDNNFEFLDFSDDIYMRFSVLNQEAKELCHVYAVLSTFDRHNELSIQIGFEDKLYERNDLIDNDFMIIYKIKEELKKIFRRQWKECVWIEDTQSQALAENIYSKTYTIENELRNFINILMVRNLGVKWWDQYVQNSIKNTSTDREDGYHRAAPLYVNVDTKLLSINTSDLKSIMKYQIKALKTSPDEGYYKIKNLEKWLLSSSSEDHTKARIELLKTHFEVKLDFWKDIFSNYFDEEFLSLWEEFSLNRNHIAHNKLIDLIAFEKFSENIKKVERYIKEAQRIFSSQNKSKEEKRYLNQLAYETELEFAQEEAGIDILSTNEIESKFEEEVCLLVDRIIEDTERNFEIIIEDRRGDKNKLLSIKNTYYDNVFIWICDKNLFINDDPGGESEYDIVAQLEIDGEIIELDKYSMTILNPDYVYNEEQTNYMPGISEEFNKIDIDSIISDIEKWIDLHIPTKLDELQKHEEERAILGGPEVVGNFPCEECDEYTVSVNEHFLPFGKCATCGHEQTKQINMCSECNVYTDEELIDDKCEKCNS